MANIPRKRFGQHFLCDQGIISRIVATLAPKTTDHLIEIGPGQGALTVPILKQIGKLEAIELDRDLLLDLTERTKKYGELTLHSADVLEFDFKSVHRDQALRVFGNLPYNISTPLIFHVLTYASIIGDMLFMLQKEVAERLAAKPGTEHYGRLSVMVQYHCYVELVFNVPPEAFYPPPQVQSSIVHLVPYHAYPHLAKNYDVFAAIVKQAFGQRRKTLRNSLRDLVTDEVWAKLKIRSDWRPEQLSVKDFVDISNLV